MQTTYRVSHLSDPRLFATSLNIARRKTDALDLSSDQTTLLVDRSGDVTGSWNASGVYTIAGTQVVGPRQTGWAADTGTALTSANATYVVGTSVAYTAGATLTYSSTYVQSEQTAMATRMAAVEAALAAATTRIGVMETALRNATQELKAVKDALLTHGLIGA